MNFLFKSRFSFVDMICIMIVTQIALYMQNNWLLLIYFPIAVTTSLIEAMVLNR